MERSTVASRMRQQQPVQRAGNGSAVGRSQQWRPPVGTSGARSSLPTNKENELNSCRVLSTLRKDCGYAKEPPSPPPVAAPHHEAVARHEETLRRKVRADPSFCAIERERAHGRCEAEPEIASLLRHDYAAPVPRRPKRAPSRLGKFANAGIHNVKKPKVLGTRFGASDCARKRCESGYRAADDQQSARADPNPPLAYRLD